MGENSEQLVVGVSSRALFDLEDEHRLFETEGVSAYRAYQLEHRDDPLSPGVAFPFIKRLLNLNKLFEGLDPFRVVVLSRNSPETGQRFFASCRHHGLNIDAGAFTSGQSTLPYIEAFDVSLFLSADKENVIHAIRNGQPAGWVLPCPKAVTESAQEPSNELRIAFDFDGVIIDDESEKEFRRGGIEGFHQLEISNAATPHGPGPLSRLFTKLSAFQKLDQERGQHDPYYHPALRVSVVTSRGAPSEQRLIGTLRSLGMSAAELFLMDGMPKKRVLSALRPHIFFDDQLGHLELTADAIPSVLIPFGVDNASLPV